nr:PmoA family protein [Saprospiraceae bacterium]
MIKPFLFRIVVGAIVILATQCTNQTSEPNTSVNTHFKLQETVDQIQVLAGETEAVLLTQVVQENHRPYIHPWISPRSQVSLTQFSPGHHKHQTGIYWGLTRVNGSGASDEELKEWFYRKDKSDEMREKIGADYFHNPENGHWKKVGSELLKEEGEELKWKSIYHMLDAAGTPIMEEEQTWTYSMIDNKAILKLDWIGKALMDITLNKFEYGGLFVRMPWTEDTEGKAINNARQVNERAEGQRAIWVDIGMNVDGMEEQGHIAIFDHPDNLGFPNHWRVDGQLGVGPVPTRDKDIQILQGETLSFRHQLVAYEGAFDDITLDELWADYVGDHGMYNTASLWGIAQEEGRDAKFLNAEEAVAEMTLHDGFTVNAFASEPMITQPMAFCWDDRGRMWIAENRDYESRGYGFANSGDSKILILEDNDKDGVADKQTVFLEGIPFPAAIAVGFDGIYLGAPPYLLFVPDKDKDDRADTDDIEVLLTGWGIRDRHETINSLHWGPDGWLYGLEGFATPSKIRKPKGKGKIYRHGDQFPEDLLEAEGVDINGGVWRYHPTKKRFEVVAHGFSNPWGIDYDENGQLFITACVIPHMFHIIPGGIYHRQGGQHFNPYVYKDIQTIVDHRHRSAHGGARVYLSDAFPEKHYGRLFMANIHEHAVLSDILKSNGSGFVAAHGDDFLHANNAQWIGFSMELGPEGGLYVLDWHDADICGKEVVNKETGRVYRIMPEQSLAEEWPGRYDDLNKLSDEDLVNLQQRKSSWHARRARVILQHRGSQQKISAKAVSSLEAILESQTTSAIRLRALWSLFITQNMTNAQLVDLLDDTNEYIRGWAIQFLGEDFKIDEEALNRLVKLSREERSPVVRLYLAALLQRLEDSQKWDLAAELVAYDEDQTDPNIPYMLWFGIEPLIANDPDRSLRELVPRSNIPTITQHIARRLVDANQSSLLAESLMNNQSNLKDLSLGMLHGLQNRSEKKKPDNWEQVYPNLSKKVDVKPIADQIAQLFGDEAAAKQLLALLEDESQGIDNRTKAIQNLASKGDEALAQRIPKLFKKEELRLPTIRSIASYQQADLGKMLIEDFALLSTPEKQEALQTLSSRRVYAEQLSTAIQDEAISKKEIPPYIAAQLRRVLGNGFVEIWGPIDGDQRNLEIEYKKYERLLQDDAIASADPILGKSIYQQVCWACHQMYGE